MFSLTLFRAVSARFRWMLLLLAGMGLTCRVAAEPPYPVIFVHGLNGNQASWVVPRLDMLDQGIVDREVIVHFSLNADQSFGTSNVATDTAFIEWSTRSLEPITPRGTDRLFTVNFDRLGFPDFGNGPAHANDAFSNCSGVVKSGAALGEIIDRILAIPGMDADKVILVGHSMGGLAIREYLQRTDGNGNHLWWNDNAGHRVAAVATLSTPHHGSMLLAYLGFEPNELDEDWFASRASEAVRDLRTYHYTGFSNDEHNGVYLYGGPEAYADGYGFLNYWNKDVNCDGNSNGTVVGVSAWNAELDVYTDNPAMPLPLDIPYRWVTSVSQMNPEGDGVVRLYSQWLHTNGVAVPATADTVKVNVPHMSVHDDLGAVYRGMDEPDETQFSWEFHTDMGLDRWISGFITYQPGYNPNLPVQEDVDRYRFTAPRTVDATLRLKGWEWSDSWSLEIETFNGGVPAITPVTAQNNPGMEDVTVPLEQGVEYLVTVRAEAIRARGNPCFFAVDTHPVALAVDPQTPPVIPAGGGSFTMTGEISSETGVAQTGDVWTMVVLPDGTLYGPAYQQSGVQLPAAGSLSFSIQQTVPGAAPAGEYSYLIHFGTYPAIALARGELTFTKSGAANDGTGPADWAATMDAKLIAPAVAAYELPEKSLLVAAYPNPFNAATTVTVTLPQTSALNIRIYDVLGRDVAELTAGRYAPGKLTLTLDASQLASGMYFLHVVAGSNHAVTKLVLMK